MAIFYWLEERIPPIQQFLDFLKRKRIPQHKYSFFYLFGGLAFFFFFVQLLTGVLLALYYTPTTDGAHESVKAIMHDVDYGWLIRSVHSWGSHCMVATVLVHMLSAFFMRAYRKPKELVWITGVMALGVVLGFSFTGYLLPWDTTAYFATLIGTEIPKTIPVIGELAVRLLRGGEEVGSDALRRMFTIHTIVLPLFSLVLIGGHVLLQQLHRPTVPMGVREESDGIPFLPNYLYRDFIAWAVSLFVLLAIATIIPASLAEKADPFASAPAGIRPEWYFLPLYQTLRMVPISLFGLNGEMLVNILVAFFGMFWMSIPFLDRESAPRISVKIIRTLSFLAVVYAAISLLLAYAD